MTELAVVAIATRVPCRRDLSRALACTNSLRFICRWVRTKKAVPLVRALPATFREMPR